MGLLSGLYTFVDGVTPSAANWNTNPLAAQAVINGNIDQDNVTTSGTKGVLTIADAQTITGAKTFSGNTTMTGTLTVGVDDTGLDVKLFGATSGKSWLWDESADKMIITGAASISDATTLTGTLTVGVDDTGLDVKFFGATASKSWLWDESADTMIVTGKATISETLLVTGITTHGGNVVSDTDSTDDLGTSSVRWANLFVDSIGDTGQDLTVAATTVNLPSGHVFDYNGADVTITHAANVLAIQGGDVGIGTTAPAFELEVEKDQNTETTIAVDNNTSGTAARAAIDVHANAANVTLTAFSSAYTTSGQYVADSGLLEARATASGGLGLSAIAGGIGFWCASVERMRIDNSGDVEIGTAAMATTATAGFLNIPSCAGTPTGVPTPTTGLASVVYDSTNNKLYVWDGAWTAIN